MKVQDMSNKSEGFRPNQQQIVDFLNEYPLGVVASLAADGRPQAATVAFSQTLKLELVIGTAENSRKAQNLTHDERVSFTVTDPDKRYTVQYEGTAKKLTDEQFEPYAENHFNKLPASAPFRHIKRQCYFLFTPTFVRFSDCTTYPWAVTEIIF